LWLDPRKTWYRNLEQVTTNGDFEVTFHLRRAAALLHLATPGTEAH